MNDAILKIKNWFYANHYWIFLGTLLIGFAYLLALSWLKWPHLIFDFGREAYVAWQVSEGAVLYHDIYYHYGPLASLINGGLMFIFGNSLSTLFYANIIFVSVYIIYFYNFIAKRTSPWAAFLAMVGFLIYNALAQINFPGSFNFIAPYSYDVVYGFYLLNIYYITILNETEENSNTSGFLQGILGGLIILTKPEIIITYVLLLSSYLIISNKTRANLRFVSKYCLGATIPLLLVFSFYYITCNWQAGADAITRSWMTVFNNSTSELVFFKNVTGFNHPLTNTSRMVSEGLLFVLLFIIINKSNTLFSCLSHKFQYISTPIIAIALYFISKHFILTPLLHAIPFILIVILGYEIYQNKPRNHWLILLTIFSIGFCLKSPLAFRVDLYGFILSAPALILLVCWLFQYKNKAQSSVFISKLFSSSILLGLIACAFNLSENEYNSKTNTLVYNNNQITVKNPKGDGETQEFIYITNWIINNTEDNNTLMVLPEGLLYNYITHRTTGLPYTALGPHEWLLYGGDLILSDFQSVPPDYIYYRYQQNVEGWGIFGRDSNYGLKFMQWVKQDYEAIITVNGNPLETNSFGGVLYRHKGLIPR